MQDNFCSRCEKYHVFKDGLCFQCDAARQADYEPPAVLRRTREPALVEKAATYCRADPNLGVPYITDEDDFPGWPIALGLMLSGLLACWGLFHFFLWLGRL